jgi:hypothetical protein
MYRLALGITLLSIASAKDKPTYSEHGKVVAMRTEKDVRGGGVYTVSGQTHGGRVKTYDVPVFKIRTDAMDYEVEGRPVPLTKSLRSEPKRAVTSFTFSSNVATRKNGTPS